MMVGMSNLWVQRALFFLFGVVLSSAAWGSVLLLTGGDASPRDGRAVSHDEAAGEGASEPAALTVDQFELKVKITDKQCFGSAGCSVEYQVEPTYLGGSADDLSGRNFDITYTVKGDSSGAQTGTIEMSDGSYDLESRSADTASNGVQLVAQISSIDEY